MIPQTTVSHAPGGMRIMVTHEGVHSPGAWATETARSLVSVDQSMDEERLLLAIELRNKIAKTLTESFRAVEAKMSAKTLAKLGKNTAQAVFACAAGSPWEVHFSNAEIRAAMAQTIQRNLNTAADLALRTE